MLVVVMEMIYSTFSIFDVTSLPYKQVAVFRDNQISTKLYPYVIHKYAKQYNECFVVVERNDAGGEVANILYYDIEYENMYLDTGGGKTKPGLWTSKTVKRIACSNLRDYAEVNKLELNDPITLKELRTFEGNSQGIYNASKNNFDDMVQNCWMFTYVLDTEYIRYFLDGIGKSAEVTQKEKIDRLMADMPPIGVLGGKVMTPEERTRIAQKMNLGNNNPLSLST